MPHADIIDQFTLCLNNLLSIKSVGELGTIGATPALASAVTDAFARNALAAKAPLLQMPLIAVRIWELVRAE